MPKRQEDEEESEERLEELRYELLDFINQRLMQFRDELADYLGEFKGTDVDKVKKELLKELMGAIERVKAELSQQHQAQRDELIERIKTLTDELQRLQNLLEERMRQIGQQTLDTKQLEEKMVLAIKETVSKEVRDREVEKLRRRRKRIALMLGGIAAAFVTVFAVAMRIPWLWTILVVALLFWLRR